MNKFLFVSVFLLVRICESLAQSPFNYSMPSYVDPKSRVVTDSILSKWYSNARDNKKVHYFNSKSASLSKIHPDWQLKTPNISNFSQSPRLQKFSELQNWESYRKNYEGKLNSLQNVNTLSTQGHKALVKNKRTEQLTSQVDQAQKSLTKYKSMKLDSSVVHNNKFLKKYYDSVNKAMRVMTMAGVPKQQLTKDQLVQQVNVKFKATAAKSSDSLTKLYDNKLKSSGFKDIDLSKVSLSDKHLEDLKPMGLSIMKTKYLGELDSIRKTRLKSEGIKLKETEDSLATKLAYLKQKETIWQKSYFEGVIGMVPSANSGFQFSPALAFHITSFISLGLGPNLLIKTEAEKVTSTFGYRAFSKAEFLDRYLYIQAEDMVNPGSVRLDGMSFTQHNFLAGGGVVVPFLKPLSLNFSLLYKVYTNGQTSTSGSPWIFRVGLSQIKNNQPVRK